MDKLPATHFTTRLDTALLEEMKAEIARLEAGPRKGRALSVRAALEEAIAMWIVAPDREKAQVDTRPASARFTASARGHR